MKRDLAFAGIEYGDRHIGFADLHAQRKTLTTMLAAQGVDYRLGWGFRAGEGVKTGQKALVTAGNGSVGQTVAAKASAALSQPIQADADLTAIVEAWPRLSSAFKAGILAIVENSDP